MRGGQASNESVTPPLRSCFRGRRRCLRTRALLRLLRLRPSRWSAWRRDVGASGRGRDRHAFVAVVEETIEFVGLERLLFDELADDEGELLAVLGEDLERTLASALDDVVDLRVDDLRDVLRVVALF